MNLLDLIGKTAVAYLENVITHEDREGTARFLLDRLTGIHVAAICREVLACAPLNEQVRLRIPRLLGQPYGLSEEVLTDERTTYWRHAVCDRPVLLIANTDDDQGQSLRDLTPIGSRELLGEPHFWVTQAAAGLALPDQHRLLWEKALQGLQRAKPVSLDIFARYLLVTRQSMAEQGLPVLHALGWALPVLSVPRDTTFFEAIPERSRTHIQQWQRFYQQAFNKRAPYLLKFTPSQQPIPSAQLHEMWERVQETIPEHLHPTVKAFIDASSGWTAETEALSCLEWERDNVKALFDGLKVRREPLGQATLDFYDDELPGSLTEQEAAYLRKLDARQMREAFDEDAEFYERHRTELSQLRFLKTRWDKFIFGQPIETDDFIVGLLRCLERLFEQAGPMATSRTLSIQSQRRTDREWRQMNYEAAMYFSWRYRGLYHLMTRFVHWQVGDLFSLEQWEARERQRGRYERYQSGSRATNQLKFYITLECDTGATESYSVQMIWQFNPHSICSEFAEDWSRLVEHPLLMSRVSREPVSKKGKLQAVDLNDVSTLMPVFRQNRGSLIAAYDAKRDLGLLLPYALQEALQDQRITTVGYAELCTAWEQFAEQYGHAVKEWFSEGVSSLACLDLEEPYARLLECLHQHAPGDGNRMTVWEPILGLGIAVVEGSPPAAIVAPWHPLRLLEMAVKARQICGLLHHLLTAPTVNFGDARVFFEDLAEELHHPYYPEVCLGMQGSQPILLAQSDTCADYTLMEVPVAQVTEENATNENPTKASREIFLITQDYLTLLPHESANLSILLYNCNSARLPQATVSALGNLMSEDDEAIRCQVILRHRDSIKLHELYEKILTERNNDEDFIASESSRDFMARLRIGIMADAAPIPTAHDGPPVDLVFLQDVVARLAEQVWLAEPSTSPVAELLYHVPPRGSRRRPATRDDFRSAVYLTSPRQPLVGWRYLQALQSVICGMESDLTARPVPARQVSFQHNITREIFEEVHRLGQWVVNSDELLTRRQLRNQGIQVIRYRQQRYDERSLTISSKAPLNLLDVMVRRRLQSLNLGLSRDELLVLTRRMVNDAGEISGAIVLRAAKRGQFASELIGLVLSRFLLQDEMSRSGYCGWYFLDDYATWLGQREGHLADVLALSPRYEKNHTVLVVLVSEAKFITSSALAHSRRVSAVQLRETVNRVREALFGDPGRLDRDLWLSRFADMILDGIEVPASEGDMLYTWRDAIRNGSAHILLKGYSHVFVHTQQPDEGDPSERTPVVKTQQAWQEIYGRDRLRQIVLAYHRGDSPRSVRASLGDDQPWGDGTAASPALPVLWTVVPRPSLSPQNLVPGLDGHESVPFKPSIPPLSSALPEARAHPGLSPTPAAETVLSDVVGTMTAPLDPHPFTWATPNLRRVLTSLATSTVTPEEDATWLHDTVTSLRTALLSYNLQAHIVAHRLTPNAALVRLQGSDRLRTSDVERRRTELLTTHGLQVTNILAEPGQVVVSIARPHRQIVSLLDIWRYRTRDVDQVTVRSNQQLVLGVRESNGETLYLCPGDVHAPHTLIAGTTGSGKSVLLQNLLLDIAATNDCASARITLIDPKQGADYLDLQSLPHIQGGIIVSQDGAREALERCVTEMNRRYELFRTAGVANLMRYNAQVPLGQREPVQWLIHDEFAVWMLIEDYKETVSSTVQRLGVMARAAGIFLIFAAQRPEDRVMPLQLRDNLGNRLVLRVESPGTSHIALGEEGAERLLGKGHLAAKLQNEERVILAQVPMLTSKEMQAIVTAIRQDCT
ncbi:MAG: FtsK/SpoIIIE domain-containing protein [Candidatus Tectimicrobiota bacterium]